MADTCFLCAVGSLSGLPQPVAGPTDGVGTCSACSVHVCAQHGERLTKHFLCSDCVTARAARRTLNDEPDAVGGYGMAALVAESPGVALNGLPLFDKRYVDDMHHALTQLGRAPTAVVLQVRERMRAELQAMDAEGLEIALGVRAGLGARFPQVAAAKLALMFEQLAREIRTIAPPQEPNRNRAEYALGVLAAAFAAHRAWSLEKSVLHVAGGLQLPALVILLSTMLLIQLEAPFQVGF